jgi:hypothetical protein
LRLAAFTLRFTKINDLEPTLLGSAFRLAIIPSFKNKNAYGVGTVNCQAGVARRNLVALSASSMRRTRMSPKCADSLNDRYQARENHFEVVVLDAARINPKMISDSFIQRQQGLIGWKV